jgi:hypothetical protein
MAYTDETLANTVYEEMRKRGLAAEPSVIPRIRAGIRPALERLSVRVANAVDDKGYPDWNTRSLLRRQFATTVTLTSGVGSLAALLTDPRPLMRGHVRFADIRDSAGKRLQMLADRASLPSDAPNDFAFGAVEGSTLYTQNAADGSATVTAQFVETDVTLLPAQLEAMAIEELIGTPQETNG